MEKRGRSREEHVEAVQSRRIVAQARQKLGYIRWFLRFVAIAFGLFAILEMQRVVEPRPLVLAMLCGTAVVLGLGSFLLHLQPVAWSGLTAAFMTVMPYLGIWLFAPWLHVVMTAAFWAAVPLMVNAARVLRERPDEFSAEDLRHRVSRDVDVSAARQHATERRRAARDRSLKTTLFVVGAMVVVIGIGGAVLAMVRAANDIEPRVRDLATAFAAGDFATVQAMCTNDERRTSWPKVERILVREGWHPAGVSLGAPRFVNRTDDWAEVHFDLPRGVLKTAWVRDSSAWQIDSFRFAGLRD